MCDEGSSTRCVDSSRRPLPPPGAGTGTPAVPPVACATEAGLSGTTGKNTLPSPRKSVTQSEGKEASVGSIAVSRAPWVSQRAPGWEDRPPAGPTADSVQALRRQEAQCVRQLSSPSTPSAPAGCTAHVGHFIPKVRVHPNPARRGGLPAGLQAFDTRRCFHRQENSASRTSLSKVAFLEWPRGPVRF